MKTLNKTLFLCLLPLTLLVADKPHSLKTLDFSSLVNDFMNESSMLKKNINLSGKQRMLTQGMSKLALQIDLGIEKEKSLEQLKSMAELYDRTLNAFKNGDSTLGIKKSINAKVLQEIAIVEKEWNPFYMHIQNMVTEKNKKEALKYIIAYNEKLLITSDELVKQYEISNTSSNYLEKARLRVVNVAGRQRMLTQKMTKEKLLLLEGEKEYKEKLKITINLFDTSLKSLIKGDKAQNIFKPTNKKIIEQLEVVSKIWSELKPLYQKKKISSSELKTIVTKNPLLLKEMNSMVKMAEEELEY